MSDNSGALIPKRPDPRALHTLYVWGDNTNGIHPETTEGTVDKPQPVLFFDGKVLRSVSLGFRHAAAVDDKGNLYQWGSAFGQPTTALLAPAPVDNVGTHKGPAKTTVPLCTLQGYDVAQVFCGFAKTYTLTESGQLFAMPVSSDVAVSTSSATPPTTTSTTPEEPPAAPTELGWASWLSAWWWTNTKNKETSTNEITAVVKLSKLPTPSNAVELLLPPEFASDRIVKVTGGYNHVMVLTDSGKVFAGAQNGFANQVGQLGLGYMNEASSAFDVDVSPQELILVPFDAHVVDIACGAAHTVFLTEQGDVYAFGANRLGQLGLGAFNDDLLIVPKPSKVTLLPPDAKCTHIAAGGDNIFFVMNNPTKSELYGCGAGLAGQLGIGSWPHVKGEPALVQTLSRKQFYDEEHKSLQPIRIKRIAVGQRHVAAVLDTTYADTGVGAGGLDVWTWGYNKFFQLGLRSKVATAVPQAAKGLESPDGAMQLSHLEGKIIQSIVCGYDTTAVFITKNDSKA